MGLEIDPKQVEAIKAFWHKAQRDRVRLRMLLAVTVFVLGWMGLVSPYEGVLEEARAAHDEAKGRQERAQDILTVLDQREIYRPLLACPDDDVSWQDYVLEQVQAAGVTLSSLEPFRREETEPFVRLDTDLVATADGYAQIVDLVDRFERGERPLRVVHVAIEMVNGLLTFQCGLHALVLPSEDPPTPEQRAHARARASKVAAAWSDTTPVADDEASDAEGDG